MSRPYEEVWIGGLTLSSSTSSCGNIVGRHQGDSRRRCRWNGVKGELDRGLGLLGAGPVAPGAPVCNFTGLVKKRKKPALTAAPDTGSSTREAAPLGNRKAEDEPGVEGLTE